MRALIALLAAVVVCVVGVRSGAATDVPIRVIVNTQNSASKLERRTIMQLFLKKRTRWSDDRGAQPVDLSQQSETRARFSRQILGRDVASVRRYWAELVFSGRGVPPPELGSDADVIKYVTEHAGAIGYVSAAADVSGVKVIEVQ